MDGEFLMATEMTDESGIMSTSPWNEIEAEVAAANDYNSTAEAVVNAVVKTFKWAAGQCGLTGFQAEWAALTAYGKMLHINGPYKVTRAENVLYPQYDLEKDMADFIEESLPWLVEQAKAKLAEHPDPEADLVHPDVYARWEALAAEEVLG